ncbi:hypothetical protein QFZ80_000266 [Paenibacillus sp. V4I7]|nr:hypothetical protein [Paenibacillus sp. V4I7]MDQ0914018.1 hypothetical protein [Paenibacillus sp. V4I5]
MKKKHSVFLTRFLLCLMIFELVVPFLSDEVDASTQTTTRVYVDFSNPSNAGSTTTVSPQYSSSSTKSLDVDLSRYEGQ